MKKYNIILFLALYFSLNSFSQEYRSYSFTNFETEWTHHSYNEELLDKGNNDYFLEDIVFTEDYIYVVYTIMAYEWFFNGFLLEKIDLNTGILEWQQTYYQESFYLRDSPSRISFRDKKTLVLSTFRQLEEENQGTSWYASQMNNWVFDSDSGELLDTLTTTDGDPNHVPMKMNINLFLNHLVQSVLHEENGYYKYLYSSYYGLDSANRRMVIIDYNLNEFGHTVSKDSVCLPLRYPRIYQSYTTRLGKNKIFNYRKSYDVNNPKDSFNIEITHLDSSLNILYTKEIGNNFFGEDHKLIQMNDSRFSVVYFGDFIFENQPHRYRTLYVYDLEGNLLEEVALERQDGSALYSLNGFNVLPIEDLNQTLVVSFNRTEMESYLEWFLTTPNGGVEQIGKTFFDNIHDKLSWSFFNPLRYMKYLGDGKILLHAQHRSKEESNNTTGTNIPSLFIISLDELRTTVATENTITNKEFIVYPNPSYSEINIKGNFSQFKSYEIANVKGELIQKEPTFSNTINIENFTNGIYILKLYDKDNNVYLQKIIKQKR